MPSFDTPDPISATVRVDAGSVRLIASGRADTEVVVLPRNPKKDADLRAAERTEVTYAGGVLTVAAPKIRYPLGRGGVVDVVVELPTGSRVEVAGSWAELRGEGRLGEVRAEISSGEVSLESTGPLRLTTSHGEVSVDHVQGGAEISSSSGNLRIGTVEGTAVLKNTHGSTSVGAVTGELRASAASGGISVGRAEGSVHARTAHGALRIAEIARGSVELESQNGSIEVGIRPGSAAWLDVSSERGHVHNALTATDGPEPEGGSDTVEVRARTRWGNIEIRRAR